ncbi:MAG: stage II sporulation protein P [Lachnoclostridium sp.]|jgi:stage II sporulation protein P|nr:stage II sporulation protein P [Lachnoclostridium sp.]
MMITMFIGLASCFIVGGFEKIPGIDFIAEKIYMDNLNLYRYSELDDEDGQGERSFLQTVLSGKAYFDEEWVLEDEEKVALALEENLIRKDEENNIQDIEPSEGKLGDIYGEEEVLQPVMNSAGNKVSIVEQLKRTNNSQFLMKNFYIVDSTTSVTAKMFPVNKLLERDNRLKKIKDTKQILIYHTHGASESFLPGRSASTPRTIVNAGETLAKELEAKGYGVYHDKTKYDLIQGSIDRSAGYNVALHGITDILNKNKDIQIIIDLHRDGVGKDAESTVMIDGKKTARVMFFNGLSRSRSGEISYLKNPNLEGNLSFSLQLKCVAMEMYPNFTKPIYLKGYRYNLHLRPRSLLIELGNEFNTIDEANNATKYIANVISKVLEKK